MKSFFLLALIFLLGSSLSLEANEPYDNNLAGKKLIYSADEAEDGPITFEINYMDFAGNPGSPITVASDSLVITMDGTLPEITEINLSSLTKFYK